MTEKYYSVVIPSLEYTVTEEYIDRNHQNFIIVCGFTSDYYEYIKKTCVQFYPYKEIFFIIGFIRKIYYAIRLSERKYAVKAFVKGVKAAQRD